MQVEGGDDVEGGGVEGLQGGDAGLEEVAGVPELGTLVHVLVEPLVADGKVELLHEEGEAGVERPEQGQRPLQELDRHGPAGGVRGGGGDEAPLEFVDPPGEERVEAVDGARGRRIHSTETEGGRTEPMSWDDELAEEEESENRVSRERVKRGSEGGVYKLQILLVRERKRKKHETLEGGVNIFRKAQTPILHTPEVQQKRERGRERESFFVRTKTMVGGNDGCFLWRGKG